MTVGRRRFISVYGDFQPGDTVVFDGDRFVAQPPSVSPEDVAAAIDPDELAAALGDVVGLPSEWTIEGADTIKIGDYASYITMSEDGADDLFLSGGDGATSIELYAPATGAQILAAHNLSGANFDVTAHETGLFVALEAATGQTAPLLTMRNEAANTILTAGQASDDGVEVRAESPAAFYVEYDAYNFGAYLNVVDIPGSGQVRASVEADRARLGVTTAAGQTQAALHVDNATTGQKVSVFANDTKTAIEATAAEGQTDALFALYDENGGLVSTFYAANGRWDTYIPAGSLDSAAFSAYGSADGYSMIGASTVAAFVEIGIETDQTDAALSIADWGGIGDYVLQIMPDGRIIAGDENSVIALQPIGGMSEVNLYNGDAGFVQMKSTAATVQFVASAQTDQTDPLLLLMDDGGIMKFRVTPLGSMVVGSPADDGFVAAFSDGTKGGVEVYGYNGQTDPVAVFGNGFSGAITTRIFMDGGIQTTLPTVNPAIAGRLWNDGGTVKVSAG